MSKNKEPKVLVYDIETTPCLAWVWRCGEQSVRHGQLHSELNETKIICITYRWLHEAKAKALVFDIESQDDYEVLVKFDKLIDEADIILGKNNVRFDDKHINMRRFRHGLDPKPDWSRKSDDLEKWMRKHFNMQSYSLDYFDKITGGDGKIVMIFQDWVDIVSYQKNKSRGIKALRKMVAYGKKDADDTAELIKKVQPYIIPKFNHAAFHGDNRCTNCGSENIIRWGTRAIGNTRKQRWHCKDHGGFAGYTAIKMNGEDGKIGN